MTYSNVVKEIKNNSSKEKAEKSKRFFKTEKGQYGFGDVFVGLTVPEINKIAKKYKEISLVDLKELLNSKIHEVRYVALNILVLKYEKADETERKNIVNLYLKNTKKINNWDLVDTSASYILGDYLLNKNKDILYKFSKSKLLWERRISIISTHAFIKQKQFQDTLKISRKLFSDKEDLIHKAVGWMLREVGKKDAKILKNFLKENIKRLPRTTLRYAIEKFSPTERKSFLRM